LRRWKELAKRGASDGDKYTVRNSWINDRFTSAGEIKQHVITQTLQWVLAANFQFTSSQFAFKASAGRVHEFKKRHNIRQRSTEYIRIMGNSTFEVTIKAVELFKKQRATIISVPKVQTIRDANTMQILGQHCHRKKNIQHEFLVLGINSHIVIGGGIAQSVLRLDYSLDDREFSVRFPCRSKRCFSSSYKT
jgi:hypothetical protein